MNLNEQLSITTFRNDWQKASMSLLYTYGFLNNGYENFFKKFSLTSQQYNALRILRGQYPTPVSTSFLREKMLDKMSDASRLVSRLNAKGFVTVAQNPADKRLVNIVISDKGLEILDAIDIDLYQLDGLLQGLTEQEAGVLVDLLQKVRDSIMTAEERLAAYETLTA
ncbi:MarR family winged helix-turn-helix transcriptional regulator [Pontibacter chinhatensis]|uniref:DNA-binding transcriptional regulator, MarR family n=1 Tax=Pontibacter chinhatensis TaxID=1436961 RepID=A0A1I2M5X4_9BACT|nr:MarR family transcriptional regulator [Pontibacter chinhatensis]SFF84581.1 DNA-binding transcriptional regulator, MarR family [Pontibacter chinhatensis]